MKCIENIQRPFFEIYLFFFTLFLIILFTFPLIINSSETFFGPPADTLGGIWDIWWIKFSHINNIPYQVHNFQAYPFGVDHSNEPFPYIYYFLQFLLANLTNEITAFNILKLISFPLLALTSFLLFYYLTKDRISSAILGIVYAFSPFHTIHTMVHFTNLYWLPFALLFLLKTLNEGGYRNALLFGLFWGICFVDNAYYGYFILLLIPFIVCAYLTNKNKRNYILRVSYIKAAIISFTIFLLVILPEMYPLLKGVVLNKTAGSIQNAGIVRAFSDLFIFSAKPLDYLLPSIHNPFLGWLIPDLGIGPLKGHRYTEHTLYLGYSLLFLAGYALYSAIRKKEHFKVDKDGRFSVYLFLAVAIVAGILSAPPFIPLGEYHLNPQTREVFAEYKLYLPQYFLFKLFPMFRVYARMGAIVLLAVCILAAFGLRELLIRINTKRGKYLFLFLFSLIIFVEFAEFPPFRITKVQEPNVYKWLASRPGQFPVVEYPLGDGFDPYTTYEYKFYQRIHTKFLVNGATKGTPADEFRKEIIDISKEKTIDKLKSIGVKYIILHKYKYLRGNEYVPLDWLTTPPRDKIFPLEYNDGRIPDLKRVKEKIRLIKDFKDSVVYEIIND